MNITLSEISNNHELFTIEGIINYENIKDLNIIRYSKAQTLILNLSNCTSMDSTAIGLLCIIHKSRERKKQTLILKSINQNIINKLISTNLIKIFNIIP